MNSVDINSVDVFVRKLEEMGVDSVRVVASLHVGTSSQVTIYVSYEQLARLERALNAMKVTND